MITDFFIPAANPFMFVLESIGGSNVSIDYDNYFPVEGLMELNTQYQAGIFPTEPNVFLNWKINEEINIQVNGDILGANARIYCNNTNSAMATHTITPSGYTVDVRRFSYTPTVSGYYYITIRVATPTQSYLYRSHTFKIVDDLSEDKKIIELGFYSDENINGFVFDANRYKAYYTGQWKVSPQQRNSSIVSEDVEYVVASQSFAKKTLIISDIHHIYYDVVAKQMENKYIYLNGMAYTCKEPPEIEYKDKSDLVDITCDLTAQYDNNYINIP